MNPEANPWPVLADAEEGRWYTCSVGPLAIAVRRRGDEWHAVTTEGPEADEAAWPAGWSPGEAPGEERDVHRWLVGSPAPLVLVPVMPDRALVVRPAVPLSLLPGTAGLFYVAIPCWVRFGLLRDGSITRLGETPTVTLSNTWYGTPSDGLLCYAMQTFARRRLEDLLPRQHRAVCTVEVRNRGPEAVVLERLCLHAEHLAVYAGATRLWTNAVTCTLRNPEEPATVDFAAGAPGHDAAGEVISPARSPRRSGLLRWMRGRS